MQSRVGGVLAMHDMRNAGEKESELQVMKVMGIASTPRCSCGHQKRNI